MLLALFDTYALNLGILALVSAACGVSLVPLARMERKRV
jgi:hypothetical protein